MTALATRPANAEGLREPDPGVGGGPPPPLVRVGV
jgi:hypothetical protein